MIIEIMIMPRLEWLESSCSEMSDELEGRRRETEELRMENVEMGKRCGIGTLLGLSVILSGSSVWRSFARK